MLVHLTAFLLAGAPCFVVAWFVYQRASDRTGHVMVGLLICCGLWPFSVAIQIIAPTLEWQLFWFLTAHLVLHVGMTLWLVFALLYTGRAHWLSRPVLGVIVAIGALSMLARITNPVHSLIWSEYQLVSEPFVHLLATPGPLYWFRSLPLYLGLFVGIGAVAHMYLRSRRIGRAQSTAFLVLGILLFLISVLRHLYSLPAEGLEYTALGSIVFCLFVAWALFYSRLFVVAPLARDVALEAIADGIVVLDVKRRIVDYNAAATTLLPTLKSKTGAPFETAFGDLQPNSDSHESTDSPREQIVEHNDRSLSVSETAIERAGRLHGSLLVIRDVTELEAYATELERKTERLDQFAALLSHDLRNPVTVARGYVELAQETGETDQLDRSVAALERIDETIEVLLTIARHGNDSGTIQPVSLSAVARAAWQTTATDGATLETDLETDRIRADQPRLQQLFENLFRNSVEHGSDGGDESDTLTVKIGSVEDGFYLEDTGPGIPADEREQVFEYGYSTDVDGTGFGLAIVDSIVDAHNWAISVTEGSAGGARFEIRGVDVLDDVPAPTASDAN